MGVGRSIGRALTRGVVRPLRAAGSRHRTESSRRRAARTPDAAPDDVVVQYVPALDGDPDPGEVVWAWVPYEDDPTQGKDRPVVIIGRTPAGLAGVALTSRDHDRPDTIEVGSGPWDRSGRPSLAKLDRILTVHADAVRREGAALDRQRFDRLVSALERHHGVRFGGSAPSGR